MSIGYERLERVALFAQANGWKRSAAEFDLDQLAANKMHGRTNYRHVRNYDGDIVSFDHRVMFRVSRWPVALMAENYPGDVAKLRVLMKTRRDLTLHEPPAGTRASFHYPGGTLPQIVTRPDHSPIVWPTEEDMIETKRQFDDAHDRSEWWRVRAKDKALATLLYGDRFARL
jgi:hypothetical protein